jgi:AcrR family transcriptional regulator
MTSKPPPRPYLRATERRRQLLSAAARLAGREGIGGLSMVGVATEAGVSRQLVYEHFADLPDLLRALLIDRFGAIETAVTETLREMSGTPGNGALAAARLILATPAEERHLLRVLLAYAGLPGHELSGPATALRGRMIARWSARLRAGEDQQARALIWGLVNAAFGLGDLVDSGEITIDDAIGQLAILVRAAVPALAGQDSRARPDALRSERPGPA